MILTNVGLTFLVKRRALDYLRAVIEEAQSEGAVQPIIEFRDRQSLIRSVDVDMAILTFPVAALEETKHVPCFSDSPVEIHLWILAITPCLAHSAL